MIRLLSLAALITLLGTAAFANENQATFEPSTSVSETLMRHRTLPDPAEEVWWVPTGEAMRSLAASV